MNPERLGAESEQRYFSDGEYFEGKFNYIRTYLHANYKCKMHSHQFYEMNIIASGQGMHYIENTRLSAKTGDVFVVPPGVSHGYYSLENLDIYHVLIKTDFLSRYAEELAEIEGFNILFDIEPYVRCASGKNYNLNLSASDLAVLRKELDKMIRAESDGRYVYLNALTLAFICRLCKRVSGNVMSLGESAEILGIMEYIKTNIGQKLTLDGIAAFANMSKATLNRHFKETLGLSPMNYVLNCRLARARELIAEGVLSKTDIAQICGFYDTAHMNKYI